jgi:hypothetical protein
LTKTKDPSAAVLLVNETVYGLVLRFKSMFAAGYPVGSISFPVRIEVTFVFARVTGSYGKVIVEF